MKSQPGRVRQFGAISLDEYSGAVERAAHDLPRVKHIAWRNGEHSIPLDVDGIPCFPTTAHDLLKTTDPYTTHFRQQIDGSWELTARLSGCLAAYAIARDAAPLHCSATTQDEFLAWVQFKQERWGHLVHVHIPHLRTSDVVFFPLAGWSMRIAGRGVIALMPERVDSSLAEEGRREVEAIWGTGSE